MGMKTWTVLHYAWICDKCGDVYEAEQGKTPSKPFDPSKWRTVTISIQPNHAEPLGAVSEYLLCPGCAGMLECFMGLRAE